jgi:hypothetical protein
MYKVILNFKSEAVASYLLQNIAAKRPGVIGNTGSSSSDMRSGVGDDWKT